MRRQLLRSDRIEKLEIAGSTIEVAKRIAPARRLGLPLSSGPAKSAICVTRSPGAKRKLAVRMPTSSWPRMHPVWADVVLTHPNWTSLPSVRFTCEVTSRLTSMPKKKTCRQQALCTWGAEAEAEPCELPASSCLERYHAAGYAVSATIPDQPPTTCRAFMLPHDG